MSAFFELLYSLLETLGLPFMNKRTRTKIPKGVRILVNLVVLFLMGFALYALGSYLMDQHSS